MAVKSASIEGLDKLVRDLQKFGDQSMPAINAASVRGAQVVLDKAIARAPVGSNFTRGAGDDITHEPGNLKRSLKLKKTRLKSGAVVTYTQVTCKGNKGESDAWYGAQVELGHKLVVHGKKAGSVEAKPFLRPAADESKDQILDIMIGTMNKELERLGDHK